MKTVRLSFFNPDAVEVDLEQSLFLNTVSFDESNRVLSFKRGNVTKQLLLPLAEEDNLIGVSLDQGNLTLITDTQSILVGDVTWDSTPTLDKPGVGVLDEDGTLYPLEGVGGITVTEEFDHVLLDYGSTNNEINAVGQVAAFISLPTTNTAYQLILLGAGDFEQWIDFDFNVVTDPFSMGLTIGPNGGVMLPPGTYELSAKLSYYATDRTILRITDGTTEIARSTTEWAQTSTLTNEGWVYAMGYYKCAQPTEIFIQGLSALINATSNARFGRMNRVTSAWPASMPAATMDIFKVDDYAGPIALQPVITKLLPEATTYDTVDYLITASSEFSTTYRAWYAFSDRSSNTAWAAASGDIEPWVQIELKGGSVSANAMTLANRNDNVGGDFYNVSCRVLYKPDDLSGWLLAAETDDMPRHFGSTTLIMFGQYLTIKHLRVVITNSVGTQTVRAAQLLDFQQPFV